jgi:hypothetical protein
MKLIVANTSQATRGKGWFTVRGPMGHTWLKVAIPKTGYGALHVMLRLFRDRVISLSSSGMSSTKAFGGGARVEGFG